MGVRDMILTPKDHQLLEASFLSGLPGRRGLLLSETGTGKTITLGLITLQTDGPCLWLTEKSLIAQTQRELEALGLRALPLSQVNASKRPQGQDVILVTHGLARTRQDGLAANGPWPLVIIDEAQVLGGGGVNPNQQTYRAVKALCADARMVIASTAEPLGTTHLLDLWAIGDAIHVPGWPSRRDIESQVVWQEYQRQAGSSIFTDRRPTGMSESGVRLLFDCVARIGIRTRLDDVVDDIPFIVRERHPVPLPAPIQSTYARVNAGGLAGHQAQARISRAASVLIPNVVRLLREEYAHHESVVIFTEQFDLLDPLDDALGANGLTFVRLTGGESTKARQSAVDKHRSGEARCLIGTKALEAGLNVQHASLLMSLVQSYNPAREKQREGRLRRLGSPHTHVTHAVVYPAVPLEARRQNVLEMKASTSDELFNYLAERCPL